MSASPPPPPPGMIELLEELRALEREGASSAVRFGPLSGYLTLCGLNGALRAPGVSRGIKRVGQAAVDEFYRAARAAGVGQVYTVMDELSGQIGAGDRPGERYVQLTSTLQDGENAGVRLEVELGPYTQFLMIGLLQMASRHPTVAAEAAVRGVSPLDDIARGLTASFGGFARELLERGFDPGLDVGEDGELVDPGYAAAHPPSSETPAVLVGIGPDVLYDVVEVVQPCCPRCGGNPELMISAFQAFCPDDDCPVLMWNPQETAAQFEASAVEQVLVRGEDGVARNVDADSVPPGVEVFSLEDFFGTPGRPPVSPQPVVEQEGGAEHRGDAEQD